MPIYESLNSGAVHRGMIFISMTGMKDKIMNSFNGFNRDSVVFFRELELNNNRQWFEVNRQRYKELYSSFSGLVLSMNETMLTIDPGFEVHPAKCISRIYRDVRFSRDKSPYRGCAWFTYKRPGADMNMFPVYFFELSADMYRYGMGFYSATKKAMDAYRAGIEKDPQGFAAMSKSIEKKKFMPEGDLYKRGISNDLPEELQRWFQRKNLYLMKTCSVDDKLFSGEIVRLLQKEFMILMPFYRFLTGAISGGKLF